MSRDFRVSLLCATGVHGALFAWVWFRIRPTEHRDVVDPLPDESVIVDREPPGGHESPPSTVAGGGSQNIRDLKDPHRTPAGVLPPKSNAALAARPLAGVDTRPPAPAEIQEPQPDLWAVRATMERRDRDLEMAAAIGVAAGALADAGGAFGRGEGANGGPGGPGAGSGNARMPRAIHGTNAFGNGSHGALTGRVCFLPVGTLRIAQVRDCHYVTTVYADTLDIPERQFYDGFPGVTDRSDWFLIDYTGSFTVSTNGPYAFRLHSDDGSYLYIDDQLVIDNDGKHAPLSRYGTILLDVGEHRIKVRYAQTTDRMALQLFVRTPKAKGERIFTTRL
jgi:hypothetical protein